MAYDVITLKDIVKEVAKQQANIFTSQLDDLVAKGLLVIEYKTPVLTHDLENMKFVIQDSIKLHVKDEEYIEKLEKENKELKETLNKMNEAFENSIKLLIEQGFKNE